MLPENCPQRFARSNKEERSPHDEAAINNKEYVVLNEKYNDPGIPGIAFAVLPDTGETIAIRYSERIYYRVGTTKTAEELNVIYGVSPAQAKTMLTSMLAGWKTPSANEEHHNPLGSSN